MVDLLAKLPRSADPEVVVVHVPPQPCPRSRLAGPLPGRSESPQHNPGRAAMQFVDAAGCRTPTSCVEFARVAGGRRAPQSRASWTQRARATTGRQLEPGADGRHRPQRAAAGRLRDSCTPTRPDRVAINEAVELAKRFGTAQSAQFVNGILDRLLLDHEQEQ